ncbi:MAG TPA: NADH:ubiquinone reductase (Na(+)-transporting) subunit B [Bacteroidales bacterium]|nr:NADH:ubiquinone reductase (Na(+)-transporting) subunit B [Bacteroidales bacterium]
MKAIRKYIDKIKPNFEKGGKYEKWKSTFDSFETFLYVLGDTAPSKGAHIRDAMDLKRTMSIVVLALIPALLFGMWNVGHFHYLMLGEQATFMQEFLHGAIRVLPLIVVSYAAGLGTEFLFVYIKGHEIEEGFLVSGMLVPLIVPVDVPLWMVALANIFAVIIGKEVFGGTGMNIVNPALLSRAFLFFAYPAQMSGDKVWVSGLGGAEKMADGFSGATPLANAAAGNMQAMPTVWDMFIGTIPGSVGETSTLAILIGAAILLYTGVASWKIMAATVVGALSLGLLFNAVGSESNAFMQMPAYQHLLLGGFAFGTVFMATDPVTAAQTERGKWIYGFLIGVIVVLIRVLNPAYPEGMMLAILLMNVFAPLIDYYVVKGNINKRLKRAKVQTK